jgi:hypothetical protein
MVFTSAICSAFMPKSYGIQVWQIKHNMLHYL